MFSFQLVLPNNATLSITWLSTWRVSGVLLLVVSLTSLPAKFVKADNPCNMGSWTRWTASSKSPCSLLSLIDIYSFLVVSALLARSLTVSVNKPPTSMLSTSLAILPAVAGEIILLEVNVWVRLSISDVCDPGSGVFCRSCFLTISHYWCCLYQAPCLRRTLYWEHFHQ